MCLFSCLRAEKAVSKLIREVKVALDFTDFLWYCFFRTQTRKEAQNLPINHEKVSLIFKFQCLRSTLFCLLIFCGTNSDWLCSPLATGTRNFILCCYWLIVLRIVIWLAVAESKQIKSKTNSTLNSIDQTQTQNSREMKCFTTNGRTIKDNVWAPILPRLGKE